MQSTITSFVTSPTSSKRSRDETTDSLSNRSAKKRKTDHHEPSRNNSNVLLDLEDEPNDDEIELDIDFDEIEKELDRRTLVIALTKGTLKNQTEAIHVVNKYVTKPVDFEYLRLSENGNRIFVVLRNESEIDNCIQEFKAPNCIIQRYDTNYGSTPGIVLFTAEFSKEHIVAELNKLGISAKIENVAINHGKGTGTTIVSGLTDEIVCNTAQRRVLPIALVAKDDKDPGKPQFTYINVDGHMPGSAKLVKMSGFRGYKLTTKHVKVVLDKINIPVKQIFVPKNKMGKPLQFAVLRMHNMEDYNNILTKQCIAGKLRIKFQRYKRRTGNSRNAEGNRKT